MEQYANLGGNSGVSAYEIGDGWIVVQFSDGSEYEYTNDRPGPQMVEEMCRLAEDGIGLNSYIIRVVWKNYSRKLI